MEPRKIAIQGIEGFNHHKVASEYFGQGIELVECMSFTGLVDSLLEGKAEKGVMAIENSIAGSIIPNYNLVCDNGLHIIGEHYLNVHHHLMALPGQRLEDIRVVRSHPMALLQCGDYLKEKPQMTVVEDADTAEPARKIAREQLKGVGAIAPALAAELFGLEILASEIQTINNNATRFIIVKTVNKEWPRDAINKASMRFLTDHKRGSLATVLNVMSDCNLNLTKIQSLPVIDTPWKYSFFVDVTFEAYAQFEKAKSRLAIMTEDFRVLGEYKNARI